MRSLFVMGLMLAATGAQASEWAGSSMSMQSTANGFHCGSGAVRLTLEGNGVYGAAGKAASVAGKLSKGGAVAFEGGSGAARVRFTGKVKGDTMRGSWIEALTGCGGTWKAQMVAAGSEPTVIPAPAGDGSDDASIFMEDESDSSTRDQGSEKDIILVPKKTGNQ